jgi:hypothetical protein
MTIDEKKLKFYQLSDQVDITSLDCRDNDGKDRQDLHKFLTKFSLKQTQDKITATYLTEYNGTLVGYVTLSLSSIHYKSIVNGKRPSSRFAPYFPAIIIAFFATIHA